MGTTLTNQNSIQEEIKSRMTTGNVNHSEENLLLSSLLLKNKNIKTEKNYISRVVLYGVKLGRSH